MQPTWRHYIQYVDLAARNGDSEMAKVRDVYQALTPRDRREVWPEQLCDLAGVTPGDLIGAVCRGLWESKAAESSMVSAIAQPDLLERTVKLAYQEENYRDRELLFRAWGCLPDKKGASINIINSPTAQAGAVKLAGEDISGRLKSMDEEVIEMSRQLETPFVVKSDVPSEGD